MRKLFILYCLIFININASSQIGGKYAYEFLDLTSSPKAGALGGKYVSYADEDLSMVYYNPSLLNQRMAHQLSLNYVNYFAGIKYGYISYGKNIDSTDNSAIGMQYINYGTFTGADASGNITGTFSAAEYALNLVFSHKIRHNITLGADLRPILSVYERYQSIGYSTDWGITYQNPKKLFTMALVARNLGAMIKPYYNNSYERLPFELIFGYTQELRYAPFRFSVTVQHLETPDMSVHDFTSNDNTTDVQTVTTQHRTTAEKIADVAMRHLIFGVEFLPFKNFFVRGGYNYQRRQELKISQNAGMVGFSWGFGITISRFQVNYGRATYHLAGASNLFSVSTDLSSFIRQKAGNP